ncbi:guanine nucleotide exchange factor for Rab-3A-like isoform X2 [Macrobrachium nipponense]|uniref:guanine nucleotide exchange factor for Rab-3A-like isoform X2 n=1 Tax=Macrobrachium nipponense TaxID=159736 RepID=UPI0030C7ECC8
MENRRNFRLLLPKSASYLSIHNIWCDGRGVRVMSVAVSTAGGGSRGVGSGASPPRDFEDDDGAATQLEMDSWRHDVRAKVTALKCHVMASRGLTPDGRIVAPYSPTLLLEGSQNAAHLILDGAAHFDLANSFLGGGGAAKGENGIHHPSSSEEEEGDEDAYADDETLSLEDVQFRLQESEEVVANGHHDGGGGGGGGKGTTTTSTAPTSGATSPFPPSSSSPAKSLSNLPVQSQTPAAATSSRPSSLNASPSKKTLEVNGHTLNGSLEVNGTTESFSSSKDGVVEEIVTIEGEEEEEPEVEVEVEVEAGEELYKVKKELKHKEEEVLKLSRIRDEVENELQELTANLFQEAHSMVHNANQRAASAERSLREAMMQVEVLQAEVTALKALVITSTPASPNPHLHPQLITKSVTETGKKIFQRGHRKSPSDFDLKYGRDTTPPSSPLKESRINDAAAHSQFSLDPECWEVSLWRNLVICPYTTWNKVDPVVHKEFIMWKQNPTLDRSDPFMQRVYEEDIDLCLAFPNSTLAHKVQKAIEDNAVFIEEVNPRQKSSCPKKCVLLDVPRFCKYRFRLGESDDNWYYISQLARNRIIAICDFLNYLRYIKLGLVKSSIHDVYWEIVKLRRQMALARLGF